MPCQTESPANPRDMGVDHDAGGLPVGDPENDVGGLAPHPGKGRERFHRPRHLAGMSSGDGAAAADECASLGAEETGRADDLLHSSRVGGGKSLGSRPPTDHLGCDLVDARVRALGREDRGDQQVERAVVVELNPGPWTIPSEGLHERRDALAGRPGRGATSGRSGRGSAHDSAIVPRGGWPVKKSCCSQGVPKSPPERHVPGSVAQSRHGSPAGGSGQRSCNRRPYAAGSHRRAVDAQRSGLIAGGG